MYFMTYLFTYTIGLYFFFLMLVAAVEPIEARNVDR